MRPAARAVQPAAYRMHSNGSGLVSDLSLSITGQPVLAPVTLSSINAKQSGMLSGARTRAAGGKELCRPD
ncbi:hypothetical protein NCCP691_16720 [Noviherbaspirillum aridicola]|uniref:Uncharacterized protein n=1 Tax=Noviherbaspirillum aridicola TaxID=2849687 RepID=A0ABQ4Q3H7_9BURK|nr:hypothetical protein NCCP691_16720 [Noviherbaspirillum aridicola]